MDCNGVFAIKAYPGQVGSRTDASCTGRTTWYIWRYLQIILSNSLTNTTCTFKSRCKDANANTLFKIWWSILDHNTCRMEHHVEVFSNSKVAQETGSWRPTVLSIWLMLIMMFVSKRRTLLNGNQFPAQYSSMLYLGNVASFDPSGTISKFGHWSPTLSVSFVASSRESKIHFSAISCLGILEVTFQVSWFVDLGISAVESREPGLESPLLPFRSSDIFVLSTMPQFTQLYKWVPGYSQWEKCDRKDFSSNWSIVRMVPREVVLVSEWTGLPGGEV